MKVYRSKIIEASETLDIIKPKLDKLWAQPDARVPSWATNGEVYNTFPRTANMDQDGFAHTWPEMSAIMVQIDRMIKEYARQSRLRVEPYVDQMWIHCHKPGADGIEHNHPDILFAGALYFQCDSEQGNIVINKRTYSVKTGDVLFWPADINHSVLPNSMNTDRIAAAIMVKAK